MQQRSGVLARQRITEQQSTIGEKGPVCNILITIIRSTHCYSMIMEPEKFSRWHTVLKAK